MHTSPVRRAYVAVTHTRRIAVTLVWRPSSWRPSSWAWYVEAPPLATFPLADLAPDVRLEPA